MRYSLDSSSTHAYLRSISSRFSAGNVLCASRPTRYPGTAGRPRRRSTAPGSEVAMVTPNSASHASPTGLQRSSTIVRFASFFFMRYNIASLRVAHRRTDCSDIRCVDTKCSTLLSPATMWGRLPHVCDNFFFFFFRFAIGSFATSNSSLLVETPP